MNEGFVVRRMEAEYLVSYKEDEVVSIYMDSLGYDFVGVGRLVVNDTGIIYQIKDNRLFRETNGVEEELFQNDTVWSAAEAV